MADEPIVPGLHETVITERIFERIAELGRAYESRTQALRAADAGDRLAGWPGGRVDQNRWGAASLHTGPVGERHECRPVSVVWSSCDLSSSAVGP